MNTDAYRALYMLNGFFWNGELCDLVIDYSGKEIKYPHPKSRSEQVARFVRPVQINIGRFNAPYEGVATLLREEVAPVGDCNAGHIELILTESGCLFGVAESMLLRWGAEKAPWRSAISSLLLGIEPILVDQVK